MGCKSIWKGSSHKHEKPWGSEVSWRGPASYGKILTIKKGCRTSFKMNKIKDEVLHVTAGSIKATFSDEYFFNDPSQHPMETKILSKGDVLNVQSGCPYRIEAIEESVIVEIGNQSRSDVVRIMDDYGRAESGVAHLAEIINENT